MKRPTRPQKRRRRLERLEPRRVLAGHPIITEFVASNTSGLEDGFAQRPDWIEIRNDAETPVDLQGYHLTDSANDLNKWEFTAPTVLAPGQHLVVFASSRNVIDPSGNWHTNFSLAKGGEYVALTAPDQTVLSEYGAGGTNYPPQVSNLSYGLVGAGLVVPNSVARYLIPTDASLGQTWIENSFDAAAAGFDLGRAAIGYENSPGSSTSYSSLIQTAVPSGTTNVYQRIEFEIENASQISDLQLTLNFDDGVVAYLNGTQILSENAPNPLGFNTPATAVHSDSLALAGKDYDLSGQVGLLVDGTNVLAFHALNRFNTSSDFLLVPLLRSASIAGQPGYLTSPTPGASNALGLDLGPTIADVAPSASPAVPGQALIITANVEDFTAPLDASTVRLHYRVMYQNEIQVVMTDDGTGMDAVAGDGIYTAEIPGTALVAGEMIRWYVTASDTLGVETREPRFLDALDSPQYFGTVVADASITTDLPVMQWFVENPGAASTTAGTRVSIFIDGEFYDNIRVDSHGQSTRGSAFPKKSFDFDANSGIKFRLTPDLDRVSDFNLLTNYADQTKLRNTLMYDLFAQADHAHHFAFSAMVYRNGSFYGLFDIVEDGDTEYLERLGLNSDNPLYKVNNRVDHAYNQVEKKSRRYEDHSDFQAVVDGRNLNGDAALDWDFDNLDIAELVNYLAIHNVAVSSDFGHKNMYWYRDTNGTGLWSVFPWDQDLSLGHQWDARVSPPYFKDDLVTDLGIYLGGGNRIFSRLYGDPVFREMHARRVRSLADQFYGVPGSPTNESYLAGHIQTLEALTADEAVQDMNLWGIHPNFTHTPAQAAAQLLDEFIPLRRAFIDDHPDVPPSQTGTPTILFDDLDFDADPISGNQSEEYVRLNNPGTAAVDISGWRIDGGIDHKFKGGTVIPAGGTLYVVKDVVAFKNRVTGPSAGQRLFIQGNYSGQLTFAGETLQLIAGDGTVVDALETPQGSPTDHQKFLRVTEVHYNPLIDDTEFLEFTNISAGNVATTLDLSGVTIVDGPSTPFVFAPGTTLAPGERVLVVQDTVAFQAAYPGVVPSIIAGKYVGKLSNGGERLKVVGAGLETILDVDYGDSDPWPASPDGAGASLVLSDPVGTPIGRLSKPYSYRGSTLAGGTPGQGSVQPFPVIINEVLTHTDDPQFDAIELFNPTNNAIDISGWFLSDSKQDLLKYQIPDSTEIPAGGYVVFDETHFNPTPLNPGPNHFALSGSQGDDVWLTIGNAGSNAVVEFVDQISFGAAFNLQTFGRLPDGSGRLAPLETPSLGTENSAHRVAPLLISEVHYHPAEPTPAELAIDPSLESRHLEFIEVHNHGSSAVDLTNWRIRGDTDFDFAPSTTIPAGETLVIVSFDPESAQNANRKAAFEAHFGIDASVALLGPFSGSLGNSFGRVTLQQPDEVPVDEPTVLPRVMVDEVLYDDLSQWPTAADGSGASLQRVSESAYAAVSENWDAADPTPGSLRYRPAVERIEINEGQSQRSVVSSVSVHFDREVNLTANSFEIVRLEDGQSVNNLLVTPTTVAGKTVAEIRFSSGPLVDTRDAGNTLVDGNYQLSVIAQETTAVTGNASMREDFAFGNDATDRFFRYFSDKDGDRDVDGIDYGRFALTFLKSLGEAGFDAAFDFDGDDDVDGQDYGRFGVQFFKTLPFPT